MSLVGARSSRWTGCASWQALGTSVVLRTADPRDLAAARAAVEGELAAIDRACSRFRPDSELSRLNDRPGRAIPVSPLLLQAVSLGLEAARMTEGDVDPALGRAIELAGYDRDWRLLPAPSDSAEIDVPSVAGTDLRASRALRLRVRSGWRAVTLDRNARTVRVPLGIKLDLGATAKALAADRAAAAAYAEGGNGVLVSLGGDIATAGPAPSGGWRVHVTDDHRSSPRAPGQTVSIRSGGLATSSTTVRRWRHEGRTMHHIIDPATEAPARTCWRTVSVAAEDCVQANIAATAALVRGATAIDWLQDLGLPARLQDRAGAVATVGDWPTPREAREAVAS